MLIIGLYLFTSSFVFLVKYISLVRHRDSWAFACVIKELSKLFFCYHFMIDFLFTKQYI